MTAHAPGTVRYLTCACCAQGAGRWQQHYNRDTGFGLCAACARRLGASTPVPEMRSLYGMPGVNYEDTGPPPIVGGMRRRTATLIANHLRQSARYSYEIADGPEAGIRFHADDDPDPSDVGRVFTVTYHPQDQFARRVRAEER